MAFFQTKHLTVDTQSDLGAVLRLDVAGRPVNVFNREVFADLDAALDKLVELPSLKLLGILSAKSSGFIAGADLHEFATVRSAADATALSAEGQRLMDKLANLPVPTAAVINGPCLGGGLEFALACDYRLVIDHPRTQIGLPEIELGLLPGWGGTQRLPQVVGLERALRVILAGHRLNAKEALRWGLADDLVTSQQHYAADLRRLLNRALHQGKRRRRKLPLRTWRQRLLESTGFGRGLIFRGSERILRRRVPDDMPAPWEALKAVRVGLTQGMAAGLAYEREAIGRLVMSNACRNLVNLFFERERARRNGDAARGRGGDAATDTGQPHVESPRRPLAPSPRRIGIVGAGTMGAGIAQLAALKGFDVVVREVNDSVLAAGMQRIDALLQKAVERRLLSTEEAQQKLAAMGRTTAWDAFGDVDVVIEAAIEELETKRAIFRELERHTRPSAILATNTSSLSVQQIQEGLRHPERVAGLHFFNPVHKMPLVEVVRAPATGTAVVATLTHWAVALGKTPVGVRDSPGFVVNRILMPYLNEAVLLLAEGMSVERIDETMRRFGMPMGPLELLDQVGLDVAAHIARMLQPALAARFAPNAVFAQMVEHGWLGQKSGAGFYQYQGKTKKVQAAAVALVQGESDVLPDIPTAEARERMVGLMANEAAACLAEGLAADAATIDLAMVLGTGWAPHRGGPLRYADDRGVGEVVRVLAELAQRLGPRFEPCPELRRRAESGELFYAAPLAV
jgi:3-hydroxyacyl-CoA dehydrogenase/enoyl-CoA hydratase/3-hydroxybutyryl-CoA epimerase